MYLPKIKSLNEFSNLMQWVSTFGVTLGWHTGVKKTPGMFNLKSMWNLYRCETDRTNFAIVNFSATVDLLEKRRKRSSAELLEGELVFMGLWVSMSTYKCFWIFGCHGCLWEFMGFWVSMGTYGWHQCLWVLYLNIKNIAYFLIQEFQKIWKLQKTSEITHVL